MSCDKEGPGGCTLDRPNTSERNSPMSVHANITPELLRQLLRYEPDTGKLFWLERPASMFSSVSHCRTWNTRFSGKEAFTYACPRGYRQGAIFDKLQKAHRVAWMIARGDIPDGMVIDHLDGNQSDNRLLNLRLATQSENLFNKRAQANSKTGVKGVSLHSLTNKWVASVRQNGKQKYLGLFDSIDEAKEAYIKAAEEIQGQFAYHKRSSGAARIWKMTSTF